MKWGTLYSADYVNVLYSAVREHLAGPFRFVCLTDAPEGIRPEVECLPIPDIGLLPEHWRSGAWPKIGVFLSDLYGLSGRALFIDLDMIICGELRDFFTFAEDTSDLVAIDEGGWVAKPPSTASAVLGFNIGKLGHLVQDLRQNRDAIIGRCGLEQRYLHEAAGTVQYWPQGWVISFKRHLRRPLGLDRLLLPKPPAPDVRIVAFHGTPRPMDLIRAEGGRRDRFPHYIGRQVPWVVDYWRRHGGRL